MADAHQFVHFLTEFVHFSTSATLFIDNQPMYRFHTTQTLSRSLYPEKIQKKIRKNLEFDWIESTVFI